MPRSKLKQRAEAERLKAAFVVAKEKLLAAQTKRQQKESVEQLLVHEMSDLVIKPLLSKRHLLRQNKPRCCSCCYCPFKRQHLVIFTAVAVAFAAGFAAAVWFASRSISLPHLAAPWADEISSSARPAPVVSRPDGSSESNGIVRRDGGGHVWRRWRDR